MRVLDSGQVSTGKCSLINKLTLSGITSYLHNPVVKNALCTQTHTHTQALWGRPLEIPPTKGIFPLTRQMQTPSSTAWLHLTIFVIREHRGPLLWAGLRTAGQLELADWVCYLTNHTPLPFPFPNESIPEYAVISREN